MAELPNWMWTVLGSLSVLVVGFGVMWWTGIGASRGDQVVATPLAARPPAHVAMAVPTAQPIPAATAGSIQVQELGSPFAPDPVMLPVRVPRGDRRYRFRHRLSPAAAAALARAERAEEGLPAPEAAAPPAPEQPAPKESAPAAAAPAAAAEPAEPPAREALPPVREKRTAAERAVMGDADDDASSREAAPRDVVEAALKALTPRVRRCFIKFQISGNAQVKLTATPEGGEADAVSVSGEFEGTPTGECVAAAVAGAPLPAFKGEALRLSHTYVLR